MFTSLTGGKKNDHSLQTARHCMEEPQSPESRAGREPHVIVGFVSEGTTAASSLKVYSKQPPTTTRQYATDDPEVLKISFSPASHSQQVTTEPQQQSLPGSRLPLHLPVTSLCAQQAPCLSPLFSWTEEDKR